MIYHCSVVVQSKPTLISVNITTWHQPDLLPFNLKHQLRERRHRKERLKDGMNKERKEREDGKKKIERGKTTEENRWMAKRNRQNE